MVWIMIDVETDGPIPGDYSLIQIGAVLVDNEGKLNKTFYAELKPISDNYNQNALDVCSLTREQTMNYEDAKSEMLRFKEWIEVVSGNSKPRFISDNNGFDAMFITWYFHHFLKESPFGHSSTNLGSLYKGLVKTMFESFKHLKMTPHTHHPVDDAKGNAEALLHMKKKMNLSISMK